MTYFIVPIVEGQTEAGCIERLLHRIWIELLAAPDRLQVLQPSRGQRDALIDPNKPDLGMKVEEAHAKLGPKLRGDPASRGLLLLLLDAESDCPARLAPKLLLPVLAAAATLSGSAATPPALDTAQVAPAPVPRCPHCGGCRFIRIELPNETNAAALDCDTS